jgi:hypothetical protein
LLASGKPVATTLPRMAEQEAMVPPPMDYEKPL